MKQKGFTLLELMVTVSVAAVLLAVAAPAMTDFIRNARISAAVNDFIAGTTAARSEAMKRRTSVTMCSSTAPLAATPACDNSASADWTNGWVVFADEDGDTTIDSGEDIIARQSALNAVLTVKAAAAVSKYLSFSSEGLTRNTSGASVTGSLLFCDDRGISAIGPTSTARAINVARTGRAQTLRQQDEISALATSLGVSCP